MYQFKHCKRATNFNGTQQCVRDLPLREHPFNLKGWGIYRFLWGKRFVSANFMEKNFLSLTWAEKI